MGITASSIAANNPLPVYNDNHSELLMAAVRNEQLTEEDVCVTVTALLTNPDIVADVNFQNEAGKTALYYAFKRGFSNLTALLLEKGADIKATDEDDNTPLHLACREGHTDTVKLLLEMGVDTQATNKNGSTPLHLALAYEQGHTDIAKLLLEMGADTQATNKYGSTPLHLALAYEQGHTDTVKLLLEMGADIQATDDYGDTPLHRACREGLTDIVKLLLEMGADIKATNKYGSTPLRPACEQGHTDTVKLLLDTDVDIKNAAQFKEPLAWFAEQFNNDSSTQAKQPYHHIAILLLIRGIVDSDNTLLPEALRTNWKAFETAVTARDPNQGITKDFLRAQANEKVSSLTRSLQFFVARNQHQLPGYQAFLKNYPNQLLEPTDDLGKTFERFNAFQHHVIDNKEPLEKQETTLALLASEFITHLDNHGASVTHDPSGSSMVSRTPSACCF